MKYVDDTFVIQLEGQKQAFLEHINKMDPAIKFTVESNQENGAIPFLHILNKQEADNSLSIQCTGNLCTLISTYNGIATITFWLSTM